MLADRAVSPLHRFARVQTGPRARRGSGTRVAPLCRVPMIRSTRLFACVLPVVTSLLLGLSAASSGCSSPSASSDEPADARADAFVKQPLPIGRTDVVFISRVQLGVAPGGCGARNSWVEIDFPNKRVSRGDYFAECVDAGDADATAAPPDAAIDDASADAGDGDAALDAAPDAGPKPAPTFERRELAEAALTDAQIDDLLALAAREVALVVGAGCVGYDGHSTRITIRRQGGRTESYGDGISFDCAKWATGQGALMIAAMKLVP